VGRVDAYPCVIELRGVHLHCHLCMAVAHVMVPAGETDVERFVQTPGTAWMRAHIDPHLYAVELRIDGKTVTRPVARG
jgi:hypothetical protein